MKYRVTILLIAGFFLLACDKTDHKEVVPPENTLSQPLEIPDVTPGPDALKNSPINTAIKIRQLDTKITPEMVNGIRFDVNHDNGVDAYSDKPFNLSPAGNTRISVTPQLYLKEEPDFKQGYLENIDGASVQVEMKFD